MAVTLEFNGYSKEWGFRRHGVFNSWVGKYFMHHPETGVGWVIALRAANKDQRTIVAGPFDDEEEAKAVLTALHRMNKGQE